MAKLKHTTSKTGYLLSIAALALYSVAAFAQAPKDACGPTSVIPLTGKEPPAKIVTFPPLPEPLASRGVAIIQYCTQNLHLVPVFGANALAVRRALDTSMSESTMRHGFGQMPVVNLLS